MVLCVRLKFNLVRNVVVLFNFSVKNLPIKIKSESMKSLTVLEKFQLDGVVKSIKSLKCILVENGL